MRTEPTVSSGSATRHLRLHRGPSRCPTLSKPSMRFPSSIRNTFPARSSPIPHPNTSRLLIRYSVLLVESSSLSRRICGLCQIKSFYRLLCKSVKGFLMIRRLRGTFLQVFEIKLLKISAQRNISMSQAIIQSPAQARDIGNQLSTNRYETLMLLSYKLKQQWSRCLEEIFRK